MTTQKDNTIASNKTIQDDCIETITKGCIDNRPKSPIGIAPYYITDEPRMIELSNAISRNLSFATSNINREEAKKAYKTISIWAYERNERAIYESNADKMHEMAVKMAEDQMKSLAKRLMVTYAKTDDRWFLYVSKDQGINERDGVYSCSINHILLTFRTEEEYKKALSNINKKPLCRVMYGGEITPEMINKLREMVEWQD